MRRPILASLTLAAALATPLSLAGCGSDAATPAAGSSMTKSPDTMTKSPDTMTKSPDTMTKSPDTMSHSPSATGEAMKPGAYLTKDEYTSQMAARQGTKVVYFFHASWCPDCRATEQSLTKDGVPAGLTVVKVDYDTMTDLKKQYGVTQQHTFVQVDHSGSELAKWTGTFTGADIKAKTV